MENNNEIMNEEIIEATEEIVKMGSRNCLRKATNIGLMMLAGGLACKFVVEPTVARFKAWRKNRHIITQINIDDEDDFDEDIVDDSEE